MHRRSSLTKHYALPSRRNKHRHLSYMKFETSRSLPNSNQVATQRDANTAGLQRSASGACLHSNAVQRRLIATQRDARGPRLQRNAMQTRQLVGSALTHRGLVSAKRVGVMAVLHHMSPPFYLYISHYMSLVSFSPSFSGVSQCVIYHCSCTTLPSVGNGIILGLVCI